MTTTGDLRDFRMADILQMLAWRRHTGRLTIMTKDMKVEIYVDSGRLALATTSDPDLRIGQLLVDQGTLRAHHLQAALRAQAETGGVRSLGDILVERGWIGEEALAKGLEEQAVTVLTRLLDVEDGAFIYQRLVTPPPHLVLLPLPTDRLLMEAARRLDELLTGVAV